MLNDGWEGPPVATAGREAPVTDLAASGYVAVADGRDAAVFDVGELAPPHLPPHAHADALSFVLWGDDAPAVVDPGSYRYDGPDRRIFRSTLAHNTVAVDGADQCDLWGPFRAAFMPRVRRLALERNAEAVVVVAEHDGYRRLANPVVHRRAFCWLPGDGLIVVDTLHGHGEHEIVSSLHLPPGANGPVPFRAAALDDTRIDAERSWHAPYLGVREEATVLRQRRRVAPGAAFGWVLLRSDAEVRVDGARLRVRRPGRPPLELTI
jgi:hypothetical protein